GDWETPSSACGTAYYFPGGARKSCPKRQARDRDERRPRLIYSGGALYICRPLVISLGRRKTRMKDEGCGSEAAACGPPVFSRPSAFILAIHGCFLSSRAHFYEEEKINVRTDQSRPV
ncbi:MAG: hypothetical protein LC754_18890, partial [Acidobacteria bacterium]|nr:hypothetical protein [Acidobacteriota bacterium]